MSLGDLGEDLVGLALDLFETKAREGVGMKALGGTDVGALDLGARRVALHAQKLVEGDLLQPGVFLEDLVAQGGHLGIPAGGGRRRAVRRLCGPLGVGARRSFAVARDRDLDLHLILRLFSRDLLLDALWLGRVLQCTDRVENPEGREGTLRAGSLERGPGRQGSVQGIEERAQRLVLDEALSGVGEEGSGLRVQAHPVAQCREDLVRSPVSGDPLLGEREQIDLQRLARVSRRHRTAQLELSPGPAEAFDQASLRLIAEGQEEILGPERLQRQQGRQLLALPGPHQLERLFPLVGVDLPLLQQQADQTLAGATRLDQDRRSLMQLDRLFDLGLAQRQRATQPGALQVEEEPRERHLARGWPRSGIDGWAGHRLMIRADVWPT